MLKAPTPFGHEMAGTDRRRGFRSRALARGRPRRGGQLRARAASASGAPAGRENLCSDLHYLNGAFSEYLLVPRRFAEVSTYPLPGGLPFEIAALAEPLACVLHGLETSALERAVGDRGLRRRPHRPPLRGRARQLPRRLPRGRRAPHRAGRSQSRRGWRRAAPSARTRGVQVSRDGGEAARLCRLSRAGDGFDVAIEATGSPAAWQDALASVRPGGLVQLFGGCPPGTNVPLDTHRLHYSRDHGEERLPPPPRHLPARPATSWPAASSIPRPSSPPSVPWWNWKKPCGACGGGRR